LHRRLLRFVRKSEWPWNAASIPSFRCHLEDVGPVGGNWSFNLLPTRHAVSFTGRKKGRDAVQTRPHQRFDDEESKGTFQIYYERGTGCRIRDSRLDARHHYVGVRRSIHFRVCLGGPAPGCFVLSHSPVPIRPTPRRASNKSITTIGASAGGDLSSLHNCIAVKK
jgi:hypothetical protein